MPWKHSSRCLSSIGLVARLTTTVTRNARGRAITIGSTTGQGIWVISISLPRMNFAIPSGTASDLWTKTIQNTQVNVPTTSPAIAPCVVVRLQNRPKVYMERKAEAHRPKNMAVPRAMMLPGRRYPSITAIAIAAIIPILVITIDLSLFF